MQPFPALKARAERCSRVRGFRPPVRRMAGSYITAASSLYLTAMPCHHTLFARAGRGQEWLLLAGALVYGDASPASTRTTALRARWAACWWDSPGEATETCCGRKAALTDCRAALCSTRRAQRRPKRLAQTGLCNQSHVGHVWLGFNKSISTSAGEQCQLSSARLRIYLKRHMRHCVTIVPSIKHQDRYHQVESGRVLASTQRRGTAERAPRYISASGIITLFTKRLITCSARHQFCRSSSTPKRQPSGSTPRSRAQSSCAARWHTCTRSQSPWPPWPSTPPP